MIIFASPEEALRFVADDEVEMVDLTFTDLIGRWHHVTLPGAAFKENTFSSGVAIDSSSVPGFKSPKRGDNVLVPDLKTGRIDPFWETKTLTFTCSVFEAGTMKPFIRDPRNVLKKAEDYLASLKIADGCKFSPEYEFYIFDGAEFINQHNQASYFLASQEAGWIPNGDDSLGLGNKIPHQSGYHAMPPRDLYYNIRADMVKRMTKEGIKVKYHHHEVGAPGQLEIEVLFEEPLDAADQGMLIKYIARMVAKSRGKTITFMPKPLYDTAGSGMHFHQFLHAEGKSLFYEEGGYANLSPLAIDYIAGLLKHTPAVMGFTNASTNSYKRLVPGFEAPTRIFFGLANRSACIRIPKYDDNELVKRIEFRPGDATGNIYLAIAAQLLAGLDGVKNKFDASAYNFGPFDQDIKNIPPEQLENIGSVPTNLQDALDKLDGDRDFLTSAGVFTDDLIDAWIDFKLENEFHQLQNRPHPYEMELYFDI